MPDLAGSNEVANFKANPSALAVWRLDSKQVEAILTRVQLHSWGVLIEI